MMAMGLLQLKKSWLQKQLHKIKPAMLAPRQSFPSQLRAPLLKATCSNRCSRAMSFRTYDPERDHPQVIEICKDVYDGTDFMPAAVNRYASGDVTTVLVMEAAGGAGGIDGLICAEPRGDVLWVFGVRVRASRRGAGVGTQLLNAALDLGRGMGLGGALSVTIMENAGMRRVFERAGMAQRDRVDVWPCRRLQRGAERARREAGGGPPATVDELAPGWADVLLQTGGGGGSSGGGGGGDVQRLLSLWRQCRSVAELRAAVEALQQKQRQGQKNGGSSGGSGGGGGGGAALDGTNPNAVAAAAAAAAATTSSGQHQQQQGEAASSELPAWVPHVYAACPVEWEKVGQWVEEGHIWILPAEDSAGSSSSSSANGSATSSAPGAGAGGGAGGNSLAILALVPSAELSGCYAAGIRAASTAAAEVALLHARALQPAFRAYVQCVGCRPPRALCEATGPADDFLVYYKPL